MLDPSKIIDDMVSSGKFTQAQGDAAKTQLGLPVSAGLSVPVPTLESPTSYINTKGGPPAPTPADIPQFSNLQPFPEKEPAAPAPAHAAPKSGFISDLVPPHEEDGGGTGTRVPEPVKYTGATEAPKGPVQSMYEKYTHPEKQATQGAFLGALGHEGEAKVNQAQAANFGHQHAADELFKAVDEQQKLAKENADKEAARIQWSQEKLAQYEKMDSELAAKKIDPNHYWQDGTAIKMLTAGIGMIFGIYGAPATGGVNSGVQAIEKSITQDIETQKANLASEHAAADKRRGLFADYMGVFQNERMAEAATQASMWQAAKTKIEAYNQMASGDIALGQGQEALAGVEEKHALAQNNFVQAALDAKTAEERAAAQAQAAYYARMQKAREERIKLAGEVAKHNAEMYAKGGKAAQIAYTEHGMPYAADMNGVPVGSIPTKLKDGDTEAPVITGINKETGDVSVKPGLAYSKESASNYSKLAYELAPAITAAIKLKKLQEKYGYKGVSLISESAEEKEDRAMAQSYSQTIRSVVKGPAFINAGAALSPGELKMLNEIAVEDPLESRKVAAMWGAAKGAGAGLAAGGFITPHALVTAAAGAGVGGSAAYDANPVGKKYDAIADSLQQRLDTATKLHFTVIPPRDDGSSFKPLSFGKPTSTPVQ